jgi:ferredoxin-NADP reductase
MLGRVNKGDELIIRDVWGAIQYKKPGIFIAGGAGITPFIAIFRELYQKGQLKGNRLIYSNKKSEDVILTDELQKMLGDDFINIFTRENVTGFMGKRIDRKYLIENIADFGQHFYICGPAAFVKNISNLLIELGVSADEVAFEK